MEWFRFYTRTLDSRKVQNLVPVLFKAWVNLCCLARVHDGPLPNFDEIGFRLRVGAVQAERIIRTLKNVQLIDEKEDGSFWMHDWDEHQHVSDNVTLRVRKHREKRFGNVSVTAPEQSRAETETEQSRADAEIGGAVERMYARHPKKKDLVLVPDSLEKAVSVKSLEEIEAVHSAWCTTPEWKESNGRFVPSLAKWLSDRGYLQWPEGMAPETPTSKRKVKIIPYDPYGTGNGKPIEIEVVG